MTLPVTPKFREPLPVLLNPVHNTIPVSRNDQLLITSVTSLAGITLTIVAKILALDGSVSTPNVTVTLGAARSLTQVTLSLPEGYLVSVVVNSSGNATTRGGTFVVVRLTKIAALSLLPGLGDSQVLISDYVTQTATSGAQAYICWPGGTLRSPLEGPGRIYNVAPANPAAGAEIIITVPGQARWRLIGISFTLTTSAVVANRIPSLVEDDGAATLNKVQGSHFATVVANGVQEYSLSSRSFTEGTSAVGDVEAFPSEGPLPVGFRIRTVTAGIQAADQYSAIGLLVEEWLDI